MIHVESKLVEIIELIGQPHRLKKIIGADNFKHNPSIKTPNIQFDFQYCKKYNSCLIIQKENGLYSIELYLDDYYVEKHNNIYKDQLQYTFELITDLKLNVNLF